MSSIRHLQTPRLSARHGEWHDTVRAAGREHATHARTLRAAATIVPHVGVIPDFLTLSADSPEAEAHFDALLALPRQVVRADLDRTFRSLPLPDWAKKVYEHGRLTTIVDVLRSYHRLAIKPVWPEIERRVKESRARYAAVLLDHGADAVLGNLSPAFGWHNPDLVAGARDSVVIELGGRGLLAQPVHFCPDPPSARASVGAEPTLAYPACGEVHRRIDPNGDDWAVRLGRLVGLTRARVLTELVVARTTSELATRLAVSQGSISQHTKVLRDAGLLTTSRLGNSVRHALTTRGRILIAQ